MSSPSATAAYDDVILDHIRNARNYRVPAAGRPVTGSNPLCGDELTLHLDLDGGRITDIGFQCTCCGLSMASASVMTEFVKGMSAGEAARLLQQFMAILDAKLDADGAGLSGGQQALLDAARRFPARARCVALPWVTLMTAMPAASPEGPRRPALRRGEPAL
jgi:nitrogen fixation NifU-like protein